MEEVWKDIPGFEESYQVSNLGRVRSKPRIIKRKNYSDLNLHGKIISQHLYYGNSTIPRVRVNLCKNSKNKVYSVHRLVAIAFIPNPNNLPQVNHKDENPLNNNVDNLEWCDNLYNHNYGTRNERQAQKLYKRVKSYTKSGMFLKEFDSIKQAAEFYSLDPSAITKVCKKKFKYTGDYIFTYA